MLATFMYRRSPKCSSSNLTHSHASVRTVSHTRFENAAGLFFLLGVNKGRLESGPGMVATARLSGTIIECIMAVCNFLSVFFMISVICEMQHSRSVMSNWNTYRGGQK